MKSTPTGLALLLLMAFQANAQQTIPLYPGPIPNSTNYRMVEKPVQYNQHAAGMRNISQPTLSIHLPGKPNGAAVIICPGGGYYFENSGAEGTRIAEAFNRQGVAAFVLKYRLPYDSTMLNKSIGPLQDAQQAI
ncbi:MAG TPA: alpha/beta hydrolase, partial [Hymenobacter sp.]